LPEYSKDTQHCNQLDPIETTYKLKAAQPCSYIYPIYSVVKNRLQQRFVATTRYWSALETNGSRHKLKDQCPAADFAVRRLNLELVCFDMP